MEECLRHPEVATVVGELAKYFGPATKRLQLVAEESRVAAFVSRRGTTADTHVEGTAATSR